MQGGASSSWDTKGLTVPLNPLSSKQRYTCELCGKPATIMCGLSRCVYYCSTEHQAIDWAGIHGKIWHLLAPLRQPPPPVNSEEERQRRILTIQMSTHALLDLCKNEAGKFLVRGQYELAIPGALKALRFAMDIYGSGHIELVSAYLLLAEANLGLGRYKIAEEFLSLANWSVFKNPSCKNALRSQLHRLFGKLYASQGRHDDAMTALAKDVYYSSLELGPEHVHTAGGYYYLANVCLMREQVEHALAFYDKVVDIWFKFLANLRKEQQDAIDAAQASGDSEGRTSTLDGEAVPTIPRLEDFLSESQVGEAIEMLRSILDSREKFLGAKHIATGEASYVLGILRQATGYVDEARTLFDNALQIYELQVGPDHELSVDIKRSLESLDSRDDTSEAGQSDQEENAPGHKEKGPGPVPEAVPLK